MGKRKPVKRIPYNYWKIEVIGHAPRIKRGKQGSICATYIGENRCEPDITEATRIVQINTTTTIISHDAFRMEKMLENIHFERPSCLQRIEAFAFNACILLRELHLPHGLTYIGPNAFNGCHNLHTVTFPSTVRTIEERAFYNCFNLNNINLPEHVESIGNYAFAHSLISTPRIPSRVKRLHCQCFGTISCQSQIVDMITTRECNLYLLNLSYQFATYANVELSAACTRLLHCLKLNTTIGFLIMQYNKLDTAILSQFIGILSDCLAMRVMDLSGNKLCSCAFLTTAVVRPSHIRRLHLFERWSFQRCALEGYSLEIAITHLLLVNQELYSIGYVGNSKKLHHILDLNYGGKILNRAMEKLYPSIRPSVLPYVLSRAKSASKLPRQSPTSSNIRELNILFDRLKNQIPLFTNKNL